MNTFERLDLIIDKGTFVPYEDDIDSGRVYVDEAYQAKIERHRARYGLKEAVLTGRADICGHYVAIGIMDARFLRASMGYYVGEKITRLFEHATKERLSVILFCASGGARVQEGIISLLQMQKTSQACARHGKEGLLYISVLTNPTFGGVTASFATLADIVVAEENAMIGFAGQRVIEQTTGEKLPEGFQTAHFQKEQGLVDEVVSDKDMKEYIARLLTAFDSTRGKKSGEPVGGALNNSNEDTIKEAIQENPQKAITRTKADDAKEAWKNVRLARKITRPTTLEYINILFDDFTLLHGDRISGDDTAVVGGIGFFYGRPVMAIGQQKGKKDIKEAIYRNWGMVSPAGHHKAMRLMRLAEKFRIPLVFFVDTMGAACGKEAEEMGQADTIARMLAVASELKTLTLSIVVGEAGSGGALAFSVANEVWMLEHSVYSVITPEGYASIVWKDIEKKSEAADAMKMCASQLYDNEVIDRIIPEPEPVTADNLPKICKQLSKELENFFDKYSNKSIEEIVERRYERFRRF